MAGTLDHASPDPVTTGLLSGSCAPAQLGWSRKSYEGPGVAWNATRTIALLFVGEDFDADEKMATMRARGLRPADVVECLLLDYEVRGLDFLSAINGRFCGAIIDERTATVHLFNDRFGFNRVYLLETGSGLHVASEAKAILAVRPEARHIDPRGLGELFSVGCVLQNRTLFAGVTLLPPGSVWSIDTSGSVRKTAYFDRQRWENQEPLSVSAYCDQLVDVFSRLMPKYLRGGAGVGMSLTGGLDSRMILAWAASAPGTLPCYTFGGPYRDCADVAIARQLARVCGQPHTTLPISGDFFSAFPSLAERTVVATDGTMDVSGAIELYANHKARGIAPLRLTGNYGSEILRANVAFRPRLLDRSLFTPEFSHRIDEAEETYRQEAQVPRLSFIAFKQVPWHHHARFAAERSQLTPRSPFLDNDLVALAFRAPRELEGSPHPLLGLITRGNAALDQVATDRALRSHQTRWGKLKHRWQEFTAKAEYAYDYGMPRWLVRTDRMVKPLHLERLFLGRHKFYHFRIWYRDQLSTALRDGDFARPLACYRDGIPAQLIHQHAAGSHNWTLELHKLLTVQLIFRHFTGPTWRISSSSVS